MDMYDDPIEELAQQIQLRGLSVPAALFLEASRPYRQLGSQAMLFFDPALHELLGASHVAMERLLADDNGLERLIERLEEFDEDPGCDA
jgi:hypothetical protein